MKIKLDFVTNSSSQSFVVIGAYINQYKVTDQLKKLITEKFSDAEVFDDFESNLDTLIQGTKLDYSFGDPNNDADDVMVGIHYTDMDDDETLIQFKERVRDDWKECLGVDSIPGHIEASWENR